MIPLLTCLGVVAAGLFACGLPRPLRRRYCASFRQRYGVGMQIGLTVLATVLFSAIVASAVKPGHPSLEWLDAAVVAALAAAGLVDLRRFSHGPAKPR